MEKKQNDLRNPDRVVKEGDIFGYNYNTVMLNSSLWAQMHHNYRHFEFFYAGKLAATSFYREGLMQNGRYPDNSYGKGEVHSFFDPAFKAGAVYKLDGRNLFSVNGMVKTEAPLPFDTYTTPRISDEALPNLKSEMVASTDVNYVFSYPKVDGRLTGFYTNYHGGLQKISYYNDSYRTFVHHSISDVAKQNYGIEAAMKYIIIKNVTLSMAGTWSKFTYTKNPMGTVRYENGSGDDINEGVAISGYHVGGSPEIAGTLGLQYFYKYWWFEAHLNGVANNYLDPSYIQRTPSVIGKVRSAADNAGYTPVEREALVDKWRAQTKLDDAITLNLSISKLLFINGGRQLNVNLNAVNVLNNKGVRTGGFEQGRIPIYNDEIDLDNLNKFPAKFYYMQDSMCF